MKTLWMIAIAMLLSGALLAQNVTGAWQGTLQPPQGRALRAVIKVTLDNDKLKATFYPNIDQGGQSIPASSFTKDGSNIKMTVGAMNGTYEGTLSADGNSITGTWSQGGPALPLNLAKATPETAWAIPDPPPPPVRMAANANPAFEVATIKPAILTGLASYSPCAGKRSSPSTRRSATSSPWPTISIPSRSWADRHGSKRISTTSPASPMCLASPTSRR